MEARVFHKNGVVESFAIPAFVGDSVTDERPIGGTRTWNEIDSVKSIWERFVVGSRSAWIEQSVEFSGCMSDDGAIGEEAPPPKTRRVYVATADTLADVERIDLDGVTVYPELVVGEIADPPGIF